MGFFILCVTLNVYVDYGSCISYLQACPCFRTFSANCFACYVIFPV
jgi:hypothetical protein